MSTLTRPRPPVKPTRTAPAPSRPFGEGVQPDRKLDRREPYTFADLAWNAANSPANRDGFYVEGQDSPHDLHLFTVPAIEHWSKVMDMAAEEAEALERAQAGLLF